jgi:acetate kinase
MNILLHNAGSSSLKGTLMESADTGVIAGGQGDWVGSVTRYQYAGAACPERSEEAGLSLGIYTHREANASCLPDADVARPGSRGRILVIGTREDVTMLREVNQVLG